MYHTARMRWPSITVKCESTLNPADISGRDKPNLNLHVIMLPENCDDPAFVKTLNETPGILALAMDRKVDPVTKQVKLEACPFIVPGARFNEKYGWDSVSQLLDSLTTVLHGSWALGRWQD
jgi:neutral trehalase